MTSYDHNQTFGLYLAVLKKDEPSPLLPESDEDTGVSSAPGGRGRGAAPDAAADAPAAAGDEPPQAPRAPRTPVTVQIDFDGLHQRILSIQGIPSSEYSELRAGAAGTVYYLEAAAGGGRGGGAGGSVLQRYRLSDRRAVPFVTGVAEYDVSADGRKLLYRTGGGGGGRGAAAAEGGGGVNLFLVDADRNPPTAGQGRLSATLRMYLEPREEYKQIFNEGWRNQRDYLYVPNAHGSDWPKMKAMYGQLLPYVNHRADLNYLLDNMGAEIAIGHSYVRGGAMPDVPQSIGGLLGADFTIDSGRYRITRIYDTESWNPELRTPLAAPGVNVAVGDYLLSINGIDLRAPDNIYRLLDMPYMFKRRKIGPLVGKRTWGGLVHTADTPAFIDGGSMIAPRGGFFTRDGKWAVENEGTAPDIDVENWPKDVIAGKDPQLERAVQEALRLLKANPVQRRATEPPSPTWGKRKAGGS